MPADSLNYPISFEGLITSYVGIDVPIMLLWPFNADTMVEIFVRRTDDFTNPVSVELRDGSTLLQLAQDIIPAAGNAGRTLLINPGTVGQAVNLRVIDQPGTGTPPTGMNLNGYIQVRFAETGATPTFGDLTTLSRVKSMLGLTDTTFDTYLSQLITDASDRMQVWMQRDIHGQAVTGELVDGAGGLDLLVRGWPVTSIEAVRVLGDVVNGTRVLPGGHVRRYEGEYAVRWPVTQGITEVDYTYGYATVPLDLQLAADWQVAWDFGLTGQSKLRLGLAGTVDPTAGTSEYTPRRGWVDGTLDVMRRYQRLPEPV